MMPSTDSKLVQSDLSCNRYLTIQTRALLLHYRKDTIRFQVPMNDILGMKITVQEREVANYVQN